MKFSEAIKEFLLWTKLAVGKGTLKGYEDNLRQFCLYLNDPEIEDIRIENVSACFNLMSILGWDVNSFVNKAAALKKFLRYFELKRYNVIDYRLILSPKKEYKMPRVLTDTQYKMIWGAIPDRRDNRHFRNRAILGIMYDSGARVGEIASLQLKNTDTEKMTAVIKSEKSRGTRPFRQIFWTNETNNHLIMWLQKRKEIWERHKDCFKNPESLFVGWNKGYTGKQLTPSAIGVMLRSYAKRVGIEVNPHSFRHHFGTELAKKGANNSLISNLLGHTDLRSSYVYTSLNGTELREQYRKFKH